MKQHVSKVAAACFCHLHKLRQIRRRVGMEVTVRLVLALITSRLDYCNSLLAGVPQSTVNVLQRVQNAAAWLIFNLGPRDHVSDSLIELHWLPIHWRIQYKLNVLMHGIITGKCPDYLRGPSSSQSLHHIQGFVRRRALRQSSSHRDYA